MAQVLTPKQDMVPEKDPQIAQQTPHQPKNTKWVELQTKNGRKYRVGTTDAEVQAKKADEAEEGNGKLGAKKNFTQAIVWKLTHGNRDWIEISDRNFRTKTGIWRYRYFFNTENVIYECRLEFSNTEHYNYHFIDKTGDSYQCDTWRNGDHYVEFNIDGNTEQNSDLVFLTGQ